MFKYVMSLLVCACVMASPALAGGGSTGTLKITNDLPAGATTLDAIIVIADPPVSLLAKVASNTATPKDITAAGGVIIKRGRTATLSVKAGTVPLYGAVVLPGGYADGVTFNNIVVAKGKTVSVKASQATAFAW